MGSRRHLAQTGQNPRSVGMELPWSNRGRNFHQRQGGTERLEHTGLVRDVWDVNRDDRFANYRRTMAPTVRAAKRLQFSIFTELTYQPPAFCVTEIS